MSFNQPKPFTLQPPPPPVRVTSATPQVDQGEFTQDHVPAAPGEQTYASVPIPGAYSSPVASPNFQPVAMHFPEQR